MQHETSWVYVIQSQETVALDMLEMSPRILPNTVRSRASIRTKSQVSVKVVVVCVIERA